MAATSASGVLADVDTVISAPTAAAPRAEPRSPSGCARDWYAHGATPIGVATSQPSRDVASRTGALPRSTRGRRRHDRQAAVASVRVISPSAPPA